MDQLWFDKIASVMEPGEIYNTFDIANLTGYCFTDLVFILGRMNRARQIRWVGFHTWSSELVLAGVE